MKIVFVGFPPLLRAHLYHLKDTPFLKENEIEIYFATAPKRKRSFSWYLKKFSYEKLIQVKDNFLYKKNIERLINLLFPPDDISFLDRCTNVKIKPYPGIRNIEGLENCDYLIICSFGEIIPGDIIKKPRGCTINMHTSALPELRGGYPCYVDAYLQTPESGMAIQQMHEELDIGPVFLKEKFRIDPLAPNYERYMECAKRGAAQLNEWHRSGFNLQPQPQDESKATYCNKIVKVRREVKAISDNLSIEGYVRANYSSHLYPFTFCIYKFSVFSILKLRREDKALPDEYRDVQKQIIKHKEKYYIRFAGKTYEIQRYIYKGEIVGYQPPQFHIPERN